VKLINLKQGKMVKFLIVLKGHLLVFDEILRRKNKQNTFVVLQCYLYFKYCDSIFKLPWLTQGF